MNTYERIVYDYLASWYGTPGLWGGDSRLGIDCSGFMQVALKVMDVDPKGDQTVQDLYDLFYRKGAEESARFGSLIFFGKEARRITHGGISLGNGMMIHVRGVEPWMKQPTHHHNGNTVGVRLDSAHYRKDFFATLDPVLVTL